MNIQQNYKRLLERFGPQKWWPTLTSQKEFEVCLGAILTQNTSWTNVETVLRHLKKNKKLSSAALGQLTARQLEPYLKSSGFYRQKAKRVRLFLTEVKKRKGFKNFFKGSLKHVRPYLLSLNGIGKETADSMLLYAAGKPIFVVDAYTKRIGSRWGLFKEDASYDEVQAVFMKNVPPSVRQYNEYHALLVELAKQHCKKKPICYKCPVRSTCKRGKNG